MRLFFVILFVLSNGAAVASEAVSAVFTFDSRYAPSGVRPSDWATRQAEEQSGRFLLRTVGQAVDLNGNGIPDAWEEQYGLVGGDAAAAADPDQDGRTNLEEYNAGLNPIVAEQFEASINESGRYLVDTWIDSTGVGIGDLVEVWGLSSAFLTDTAGRAPDTDKDGLPDWFEKLYGLNPLINDAALDLDGDGRTNLQEYNAGTNPTLADDWTRASRVSYDPFTCDTRVWYTGGNPSFDVTFAVICTSNGFVCDTGGLYYDWDGDGIPNWWEARFSRTGSKTGLPADADDDGDGQTNYGEFVAYTNPTNALSKFVIGLAPIEVVPVAQMLRVREPSALKAQTIAPGRAGTFALKWDSVLGRTYSVYMCENLSSGWGMVPVAEIEGTGCPVEYVPPQTSSALFFRVTVRLTEEP